MKYIWKLSKNVLKYVEKFWHICWKYICIWLICHFNNICNTTSQEMGLEEQIKCPRCRRKTSNHVWGISGREKGEGGGCQTGRGVIYILGHQTATIIYILGHLLTTITRKGETIVDWISNKYVKNHRLAALWHGFGPAWHSEGGSGRVTHATVRSLGSVLAIG